MKNEQIGMKVLKEDTVIHPIEIKRGGEFFDFVKKEKHWRLAFNYRTNEYCIQVRSDILNEDYTSVTNVAWITRWRIGKNIFYGKHLAKFVYDKVIDEKILDGRIIKRVAQKYTPEFRAKYVNA